MADTPETQHEAAAAVTSTPATKDITGTAPTSPARSDKSSDSEGKNVREKLKDTQIDVPPTSNPVSDTDQATKDATNGTTKPGDQSVSGSDSERGRLRRKRSREDFEDDVDADKQPEKKIERHARKRSRDITKDLEAGIPAKPAGSAISSIKESDTDEHMTSPSKSASTTTATAATEKRSGSNTSPKNKRSREEAENDTEDTTKGTEIGAANGDAALSEERDSKRLRDKERTQSITDTESKTKIPPGSGFANTSASSPFAAMAAKPQQAKTSDKTDSLPQTSDDKFKASGFGGFAASTTSPFGGLGGLGGSKPSTSSPFGAASGNKLSSFAGSAAPSTLGGGGGGFGALGGSGTSSFGGSSFGGSLSGGFGGLGGVKTIGSFAAPGGNLEIKGLKEKEKPFGAAADDESSEDEDGDDEDPEKGTEKEERQRQSSQPLLSQHPPETGEEGEQTIWTGRAKLYLMAGEGSNRAWKERGVGTFKFNITVDEPKKARFVLRAEGTHRLLLNAAVTRKMVFGGDAQGEKPKDGRLLFNSPNQDGELEMHLLRMKAENAKQLWEEVTKVQEEQL
ncbi:hypothetical protein COCMIDRAFT_86790 [Bipolaris oryzae ATCC 44560]|uniref:RanBD1 domain-containing protein n=1 Tax=Bipolaris oryzae ATCC 44560 TaxID=930090 RepID=W6ZXP3_COCMI|nr:uncharacterized protein COCMIDRAFT_86790 [Bipolaris oryzae ATCC 44560]EUC48656.1 hypothetical protein COCMIDRAFT_86790 [Bipolaris oryzae ATCC 44560]